MRANAGRRIARTRLPENGRDVRIAPQRENPRSPDPLGGVPFACDELAKRDFVEIDQIAELCRAGHGGYSNTTRGSGPGAIVAGAMVMERYARPA